MQESWPPLCQRTDLEQIAGRKERHRVGAPAHRIVSRLSQDARSAGARSHTQISGSLAGHHLREHRIPQEYRQTGLGGSAIGRRQGLRVWVSGRSGGTVKLALRLHDEGAAVFAPAHPLWGS